MHNSLSSQNVATLEQYSRVASFAQDASVLTEIYQEEVNIAVWQNKLSDEVMQNVNSIMATSANLRVLITARPNNAVKNLVESAPELSDKQALCEYIAMLVDMFCTLFELKGVGLRLTTLDQAMCPKFHVDKVPCRLVTTFAGTATEWLAGSTVNRAKLGAGSKGEPDETSGLIHSTQDIQQLAIGDVALLKGEGWYNNENGGAIHRSPAVKSNNKRLLLTFDFVD